MNYLDISKSVIISSPAGSGKTEKLARRYIALLKAGVEVERILAITFTDRAAAEMKQRILRILRQEDEKLFVKLIENMSLMRVSTIHSFCGTLLRRFSFETALDPNYTIEDAIDARIMWDKILYEILMETGKERAGHDLLHQTLSEKGFRGLEYLKTTINYLFEKNPFSLEAEIPASSSSSAKILAEELRKWPGADSAIENYKDIFRDDGFSRLITAEKHFLTKSNMPRKKQTYSAKGILDYQGWTLKMFLYWNEKNRDEFRKRAERLKAIFNECFEKYTDKKALKGVLDFSDLEYFAYRLLTEDPEWSNVLYAFDEKTDHILVDEFQDTNNFQWAIIDRLTEEWRSGLGAKREEGVKPTVFLVGDEKQSIYLFRGANVEIFHSAKEKLADWLRDEFHYEEVRENFRSLPAIIDFTNRIFKYVMSSDKNSPSWMTGYSPFEARRADSADTGMVELTLIDDDDMSAAEVRRKEADLIAKRIRSLVDSFQINDRAEHCQSGTMSEKRPCRYMDIALLLRKRTHLKKYEEAFRQHNIPFIAVKGIGFYQEPEVAVLRALVYFLSNPKDDYSLYILLKSPFFSIGEGKIVEVISSEGDSLFSKIKTSGQVDKASTLLEEWILQVMHTPVSELIEEALVKTGAWKYFHEAQRRANVKKFIRLVEDLEAQGKSVIKIRDFLGRTDTRAEEPKANVNTEGMDAVRIMTIHGSKGLEFPIVFVPGLDESAASKSDDSLIYEKEGRFFYKYMPGPAIRKLDEDFLFKKQKEEEEQKRLFYVAVTRAEEALFLTGQWSEKEREFLGFLKQGLGLNKAEGRRQKAEGGQKWEIEGKLDGFSILSEQDVNALYKKRPELKVLKMPPVPAPFVPLKIKKAPLWKTVTESVDIKRKHGKNWTIPGDVIHRLFDNISKGIISENEIQDKAVKMLLSRGVTNNQQKEFIKTIENDIKLLKEKGLWQDLIMPRENSFSELPFVLEHEEGVFTGRIDRVIKENGSYNVYDYKTFPVDENEIDYLLKGYSFQLGIYCNAVKELFKTDAVRSFIVFTHVGEVREVV